MAVILEVVLAPPYQTPQRTAVAVNFCQVRKFSAVWPSRMGSRVESGKQTAREHCEQYPRAGIRCRMAEGSASGPWEMAAERGARHLIAEVVQ